MNDRIEYIDALDDTAFADRVRNTLSKYEPLMLEILGNPPPEFNLGLGNTEHFAEEMAARDATPNNAHADEPNMTSFFSKENPELNERFLVIWEHVWTAPSESVSKPMPRGMILWNTEAILRRRFPEYDEAKLAVDLFHELVHHHLAAQGHPMGHDKTLFVIWYRFLCALRVPAPVHAYFENKNREYNGLQPNRSRQVISRWTEQEIKALGGSGRRTWVNDDQVKRLEAGA